MKRATRIAVIGAVFLLVVAGAGALWLDSLFEEPAATAIESLAAELNTRTLLCVFAHPDDEVTAAGALADATSRGVRVHVITATRGEAGKSDVPVSGPGELGRLREAELREHTKLLGVEEQQVWSFPDGGVESHLPELSERIRREIEKIAPDAILTFHPASGFTFHRDHRAVGLAAVRALDASGSRARLVHTAAPRRVMATLGGEVGAKVAANQPDATWAMPIDPEIKLRAWSVHRTQQKFVQRVWKVPPRVLHFFFDEEHFILATRPEPMRTSR